MIAEATLTDCRDRLAHAAIEARSPLSGADLLSSGLLARFSARPEQLQGMTDAGCAIQFEPCSVKVAIRS